MKEVVESDNRLIREESLHPYKIHRVQAVPTK